MRKEIMKDSLKENPLALFLVKSRFIHDSDIDKYDNFDSKEEYYVDVVSSATIIVKYYVKFG